MSLRSLTVGRAITSVPFRLMLVIAATVVAFRFSLSTILDGFTYQSTQGDLALVPPIAAALLVLAAFRHRHVGAVKLGTDRYRPGRGLHHDRRARAYRRAGHDVELLLDASARHADATARGCGRSRAVFRRPRPVRVYVSAVLPAAGMAPALFGAVGERAQPAHRGNGGVGRGRQRHRWYRPKPGRRPLSDPAGWPRLQRLGRVRLLGR